MSQYRIKGPLGVGEQLYWSNVDGWVDRDSATLFSLSELVSLPQGATGIEPTVYSHVFALAFTVNGSTDPEGQDVRATTIRDAIYRRLHDLSDEELIEAVRGAPLDTAEDMP